MSLLPNDTELQLPGVVVIPASAGSGKTYTLSHRYVQFLLSQKIPFNGLRNILAITFTKLAAKEMKERILSVLKKAALNNKKTLNEITAIVSSDETAIAARAGQMIETILHNYSDFNVRTIDSFLTTVFKASALELGVQPNIEIEFDNDAIVGAAFRQFSQNLREGTSDSQFVDELIRLIEINDYSGAGFLWNPFSKIAREVLQLQKHFGRYSSEPKIIDSGAVVSGLQSEIIEKAALLNTKLQRTTLPVNAYFAKDIMRLANGEVFEIASKGKTKKYFNKYSDDAGAEKEIKKLFSIIRPLEKLLDEFITVYAHTYYQPFVRAVSMIEQSVKNVKMVEGALVLDDINRSLAKYLSEEIVPDVYLKLGERISHFMIDEFQDTSPIQWKNLYPLIEEALAKHGTLFAVGDTKQSIYGFRGADWHIFKNLIEGKYFPSAPTVVLPLTTNYRSAQALVDFVKDVFSVNVQTAQLEKCAKASGLYNFAQDVPDEEKNKGYVEVRQIEKTKDGESENAQRKYIMETIQQCLERGYTYGDIAILTQTNADVVEISSWLNNGAIPFLSLSTLDIRKRKIIGEIISLLAFLDSPIDNLSFTTFLSGDIFQRAVPLLPKEKIHAFIIECRKNNIESYYRAFRMQYSDAWEEYVDRLFSLVGYMPLYDLVSEIYKTFSVFEKFSEEESALVKFLECIKQFENSGNNSLKDFLSFSGEEGSDPWSIEIPASVHAVRIMTIHKAKGLGFPIVLVVLKEKRARAASFYTIETDNGLSVLRLGKNFGERNITFKNIYEENEQEQIIDDLNKIYVALTRARKEMYVAVQYNKLENLPASILPEKKYGSHYVRADVEQPEEKLPLIPSLHILDKAPLPAAAHKRIGLQETHRGNILHDVLAHIEFLSENVEAEIRSAAQLSRYANEAAESEIQTLARFLQTPDVRNYFERKEFRKILREEDFVSASGRLYRMDRIVIDKERVTILDFKTGSDESNDEYCEQVRNYIKIVSEIYPAFSVQGALLYIDLRKVVRVQ